MKRVVITGYGTINPLGLNTKEFWNNSLHQKSGVKKIEAFDIPSDMSQIAGMVGDFTVPTSAAKEDRLTQMALIASLEALGTSDLDAAKLKKVGGRAAVYIATAIAQISSMERFFCKDGIEATVSPFHFNSTAAFLAKTLGFSGGHSTVVTGCTGGLDAIGYAYQMIRSGRKDLVLTGSADAPITPLVVAAFSKIEATSMRNKDPAKASRPFDKERDGFVLGEGAGMILLESLDSALQRGAPIFGEIRGFSSQNNCYHMTDIDQEGRFIGEVVKKTLKQASIRPDEIDFINAHGSSTPQNDVSESNAFKDVFHTEIAKIPVTSVKSQIGHALSAANSIEMISSLMSILEDLIPPTINYEYPDPYCPLDVVKGGPREKKVNHVLKTSSGFSGIHSGMLLSKYRK